MTRIHTKRKKAQAITRLKVRWRRADAGKNHGFSLAAALGPEVFKQPLDLNAMKIPDHEV